MHFGGGGGLSVRAKKKKSGSEATKVISPKTAVPPGQVSLVVLTGEDAGAEHFVRGLKCVLGRDSEKVDITVKSKGVSRRHAALSWEKNRIILEDLGSTNGTFLNDERISDPVEVHHGDRIKLGDLVLQVIKVDQPQDTPVYELRD